MNLYLYSIQVNGTSVYYAKANQQRNNIVEFENNVDNSSLSKYFGYFSFYNSDDEYCFDFEVRLQKTALNEKVNYKDITALDLSVILDCKDNNIDRVSITDQIKYAILNQINELIDQNFDGLEASEESINSDSKPYNPELIRVDSKQMQISYIHELINEYESLKLSADFQRNFIWTDSKRKSRLIESILLRIPLPAFYFSTDKIGNYQIVDGIQRINVINMFINGDFKLTDLEYLEDCTDCFFSAKHDKNKKSSKRKYLDGKYVRRILETQLWINVIDPQTPTQVKYEIFKRLNTGGKPLNSMEIRNSFATEATRNFIRKLTRTKEYTTSSLSTVNSTRFADQELILRFICFFRDKIKEDIVFSYKGNMDVFLDNCIEYLNKCSKSDLFEIETTFKESINICNKLFGKFSFRKVFPDVTYGAYRLPLINKSLFTAMSIVVIKYSEELKLLSNSSKENTEILGKFIMKSENYSYYESLSYGTNDKERISIVFSRTEEFIKKLIEVKI